MALRNMHAANGGRMVVIVLVTLVGLWVAAPISAASDTIEAAMGDTINLHGVSSSSDRIYLFLTGPNLPANGVPLNDLTQRADQGAFTIVDVGSDQKWTYQWDTSRVNGRIDYGSYTVYVVADPVDRSRLGGHPFSTLSVCLTNPGLSGISISGGSSYTLRPTEHPQAPVITSMPMTALPSSSSPPPATKETSRAPVPSLSQKSGAGSGLMILETGALIMILAALHRGQR
jgi:hypothetical protein